MGKYKIFFIHGTHFQVEDRDLATKKETLIDSFQPQIQLIVDGDDYFQRVLSAIQQAQHEILFEAYIFSYDLVGKAMLQALKEARNRGVQVQLLVDGIGSLLSQSDLIQECGKLRIPIRFFHGLPRAFEIQRWLRFFSAFNNRDHRKVVLVDGKKVFLGSYNITKVHSAKEVGDEAWRDTAVELDCDPEDPNIFRLRQAFHKTWARSDSKRFLRFRLPHLQFRKHFKTFGWLRINDRISLRMSLTRDLRKRFNKAEKRILITNAYFLPRRTLVSGMKRAARRGVYVGLLLPAKTDVWFVREASRSLYRKLLKAGVYIFEYQPSVLHAKTLIIDEWATVGSYNLNHRSFLHDLEVEFGSSDPQYLQALMKQWDTDLRKSSPVTINDLNQDSWLRRGLSRALFLLRYFL